jgi:hypothetical protein
MQHHHRRPRTPERQPDLFPPDHPAIPGTAPAWEALPDRTRQALTGLLARLFLAHAGGSAPAPGGDADER